MTDSLKLAEMQRTSIEFERQRHLANWFIKSSQHMATPSLNPNGNNDSAASNNMSSSNNISVKSSKAQKSMGNISGCGKNGTITTTTNPLFFMVSGVIGGGGGVGIHQKPPMAAGQIGIGGTGGGGGGVGDSIAGLSRSQIFTSQTNLPLQIVTSSGQEGHKPKLRRFNSNDTSANMFSVADFENARLARRNEIEMKQRQQQRLKMNSLSSGGDCSTGDSKGSKYSSESLPEPVSADIFLDRYSLPRVVRISQKPKFSHETLQSSSSNGSSGTTTSSTSVTNNKPSASNVENSKQSGELYLLYRYLRQRKIYHGFNSKLGSGNRKKGVMIPQEFPGYFSIINEKGAATATMYTSLVQLVRERVYKFISVDNLPAFTESQSNDSFPPRSHYVKSTARGGQIFRLLAVFEDGKQDANANGKNNSGREKEKGRYAQLLNENRQILYVSLTTKGKFYEIEPGIPQILQKSANKEDSNKKLNPDCVHRLTSLIRANTTFPVNVKFISGPAGTVNIVPENLTITRVSTENVLIVCPIEDVEARSPLHLRKLHVTPEMTMIKCFLGFENEQRMLANQNVQNLLKFCQFNCDTFTKMVEFEMLNTPERVPSRSKVDGLKILRPLNFPKLLRREKSIIAHEKEDSIIFLSKNDLANLESKEDSAHNGMISDQHGKVSEKMKVFQPSKKKWFKRNDKHTSLTSLDLDVQAKRMSMERYHDMSKLLQERFGEAVNDKPGAGFDGPVVDNEKPKIHKSLSLQEVDFHEKPDLVTSRRFSRNGSHTNINTLEDVIEDLRGAAHHHHHHHHHQQHQQQQKQSFISEKMFSEFHVKTRQYSKSSSSLHQLLHFAVPQRMNIVETRKPNLKLVKNAQNAQQPNSGHFQSQSGQHSLPLTSLSGTTIIDDLPYSSVRDSLLPSDDLEFGGVQNQQNGRADAITSYDLMNCSSSAAARNHGASSSSRKYSSDDNDRENIYAEICHNGGAISRVQINVATGSTTSAATDLSQSSISSDLFAAKAGAVDVTQTKHSNPSGNGACIDNIYNTLN